MDLTSQTLRAKAESPSFNSIRGAPENSKTDMVTALAAPPIPIANLPVGWKSGWASLYRVARWRSPIDSSSRRTICGETLRHTMRPCSGALQSRSDRHGASRGAGGSVPFSQRSRLSYRPYADPACLIGPKNRGRRRSSWPYLPVDGDSDFGLLRRVIRGRWRLLFFGVCRRCSRWPSWPIGMGSAP